MTKKKNVPRIAAAMFIALLAVVVCIGFACTAGTSKDTDLKQPEYMSRLFDKDKVIEVNIDIDENDFEDLKKNATEEKYYRANVTIDDVTVNNVGIRAKGNSSLTQVASDDTTDRYSFKIKTDEYIDNQNIYGLSKFVLNNNIGDATNMKEYMSYDLLNKMGVNTPGFAYANIKINNEEWGIYLAVESLEDEFVERNYGNTNGNLYKVETTNMGKKDNGGFQGGGFGKGGPGEDNQQGGPMMPGQMQNQKGDKQMEQADNNDGQQTQGPPQGDGQVLPNNGGDKQQTQGPPEGGQAPQNNDNNHEEVDGQEGQVFPGGGHGGMSANGGSLLYSDDEISSYSSIFDYTIFDKTRKIDKKRLISIIKNLNEGTNLEESIDVDEVLKYFAVNTYLVNLDSYAGSLKHNYYLYEADGKMQILPWDYNLAYGAFMMGGMGRGQMGNKADDNSSKNSQASQAINFPIDTPVTDTMDNSPLISKLLEVDEYKEKYHQYLQEIVDKYINSGYFDDEIDKIDNLIDDYVKEDPTAFFSYDEYKASLPHLKQYGVDRGESIQMQLNGTQPSDSYGDVESTVDMKALGQQMGGGPKGDEDGKQGGFDVMHGMKNAGDEQKQGDTDDGKQQFQANKQNMNPNEMKQNQGDNQNDKKQMMPPDMQNEEQQSSIKIGDVSLPESVATAAICILIMIIALVFVSKFRRKKEYCK